MAGANRDLMRAINQYHILNTIRNAEAISRIEIAEITGQSRGSVTNITSRLIEDNIIYEKEVVDSSERGRKRILLALNPEAAYAVGVKLSESRISCAVTDMQANVQSSIIMPLRTSARPVKFIADMIEEAVLHCIMEARLPIEKITGIGIGIPGFVDSKKGICHWTPLYTEGKVSLRALIQKRFQKQTYIENDTNTVTLAHQWFGEGKGIDNFFVVTIEDGIGLGIVVNGQIYRGAQGFAGEFGHVVVEPNGLTCRCGKKGCIEAYASNLSILKKVADLPPKIQWEHDPDIEPAMEDVIMLGNKGDRDIKKIFDEAGFFLGLGLSGLIQIFNPALIIVSGDGVRAGDLIFKTLNRTIENNTNHLLVQPANIIVQKWQDTDWARGAASLALQEFYKSPYHL